MAPQYKTSLPLFNLTPVKWPALAATRRPPFTFQRTLGTLVDGFTIFCYVPILKVWVDTEYLTDSALWNWHHLQVFQGHLESCPLDWRNDKWKKRGVCIIFCQGGEREGEGGSFWGQRKTRMMSKRAAAWICKGISRWAQNCHSCPLMQMQRRVGEGNTSMFKRVYSAQKTVKCASLLTKQLGSYS